ANTNVNNLIVMLGGAPSFDASKISNVIGSAAPNVVSQDWLFLQQPAGRQEIYTESASPSTTFGHSSSQMTDSLAVYDLFIRLSAQVRNSTPTEALTMLRPLFEAGSAQADSSLERVVDALVNLFGWDFPPLAGSLNNNREEFYRRIVSLQAITKNLSDNNPGMHVDVLTAGSTTAESMASLASGSEAIAYRYALKALNPFAVVGDNSLYSIHNQNGELDLYNPVYKTGNLTSDWLADRAEFLAQKNITNIADVTSIISPEFGIDNRTQFIDVASSYALTLSEVELPAHSVSARQIAFGSDASEFLEGGSKSDKLYGNAGADYLRGKLNNDHLEGGAGLDVYEYNGGQSFT
ncbi:MAG: hypothetical protein Q8R21_02350, partial [Burkholderiales bacterium]|nr:hypothetical protein [Burkholderiales bacterium]